MNEKNMVKADFYSSIVLLALGIAVIYFSGQMPMTPSRPHSAPGLVPRILGIIFVGFGITVLIRSLIKSKGQVGVSSASFKAFFSDNTTQRTFAVIFLCLLYIFLLGKVSFPLLTFLHMFLFVIIFEYDRAVPLKMQKKKFMMAVLVALCTSVFITGVFQYIFLIRLP